jgi:flagellar M-ring protein FliF
MDQIKKLIANLSLKQRVSIGVAAIAVIASLIAFARWNRERDFKPLFSELSQEDAAAVVAKVHEGGTEFRLSENGSTVLVPSAKVAEMRLQLAAIGVPKSGRIGFELFDKTNFGVSDFTEQVNYHRALEGELERTVMALAEVEQARVHLTFPKDSVFLESKQPAKASVLVKLKLGAQLSAQNVAAICQLTSSAVEGLAPEAVTVVDMRGNLLSRPHKPGSPDGADPDDAGLEYKAKIERELLAKINTTLEPLLGLEKFRASVSVDCDFTSGEQSEETFDPTKSVMANSQKTEDVSGANSASGVPGTASNLPRPTSRPGSGGNSVTRRTENISFQSSRVVRRMRLPQGGVKHLSVAVLVDNTVRFEGAGPKAKRIFEAPSADQLKTLHDLVAGVVGLSVERGDQLVIESQPFESTRNVEPPPLSPVLVKPAPGGGPAWLQTLMGNRVFFIGSIAGTLLFVVLIGGTVFMFGRKKKTKQVEIKGQIEGAAGPAVPALDDATKKMEHQLAEQAAQRERQTADALNTLKLPPVTTKKGEVLTRHILEETKKDPKAVAQIMRTWINEAPSK